MTLGEILVRLRADVGRFDSDIGQAIGALGRLQSAGKAAGAGAGAGLTLVGTAALMVGTYAVKAAADFEASFAKVRRVLTEAEGGTKKLADSLLNLSTKIPVPATELAEMASMAGQMGIKGEANIMKFVDVVARLGVTAEMSGEQAAMMMARIAQVGGIGIEHIDQLASAVVGVGADFNATSAEILRMTMQMQGLASQAGVSTQTMIALSATLASAGIKAESGGTAMGRIAADINRMVETGGPKLQELAHLMDTTAAGVRDAWASDKGGFLLKVFQEMNKEGTGVIQTLDALGWKNVRVAGAVGALAKSHVDLARAMESVNKHFGAGTEIYEQSNKIFETFWSKLELLKNAINYVAIQWGQNLLPILGFFVTGMTEVINVVGTAFNWFNKLPEPLRLMLNPLGQLVVYLRLVGDAFSWLAGKIGGSEIFQKTMRVVSALGSELKSEFLEGWRVVSQWIDVAHTYLTEFVSEALRASTTLAGLKSVITNVGIAFQLLAEAAGKTSIGQAISDLANIDPKAMALGQMSQADWLKQLNAQKKTAASSKERADLGLPADAAGIQKYIDKMNEMGAEIGKLRASHRGAFAEMEADLHADAENRMKQAHELKISGAALQAFTATVHTYTAAAREAQTIKIIQQNLGESIQDVTQKMADMGRSVIEATKRGFTYSREQIAQWGKTALEAALNGAKLPESLEGFARSAAKVQQYSIQLEESNARWQLLGDAMVDVEDKIRQTAIAFELEDGATKMTTESVAALEQNMRKMAETADGPAAKAAKELADRLREVREERERLKYHGQTKEEFDITNAPGEQEIHARELQTAVLNLRERHVDWNAAIKDSVDLMMLLGIKADSTFGKILSSLIGLGGASSHIKTFITDFSKGFEAMAKNSGTLFSDPKNNFFDKLGGGLKAAAADIPNLIQGLAGVISALDKATKSGSAFQRALGGAMVGAQAGSAFGPQGAGIGAAMGAAFGLGRKGGGSAALGIAINPLAGLAGLLTGGKTRETVRVAGEALGVALTEEMADTIRDRADQLGLAIGDAALLSLPDVVRDSKKPISDFSHQIESLMQKTKDGTFSVRDGFEAIGGMWSAANDEAAASGQTFNRTMLEMILNARNMGLQVPEIMQHVTGAVERAAGGLDKVFSTVQYHTKFKKDEAGNILKDENGQNIEEKHWTEQEGGLHMNTEQSARAQAIIFATTFSATLREKGLVGAVEMMKGAFDNLRDVMLKSGFEAIFGEVLGGVDQLFGLMENEAFKGAAEAAAGLAQTMAGLIDAGYLTRDAFAAFGVTAMDAFNQAVGAGASENEALLSILPLLAEIQRAHDLYGYQLTAEQQQLMDIAHAHGLAFPTDPILQVRDAIYELIEAITGIPREVNIDIKEHHSSSGGGGGEGNGGSYAPGDNNENAPDMAAALGFYSPQLPKDQLIKAHKDEEIIITPKGKSRGDVMSTDGIMEAIARSAAGGAAAANGGGDSTNVINVYIDGRKIQEYITRATKTGGIRVHPDAVRDF